MDNNYKKSLKKESIKQSIISIGNGVLKIAAGMSPVLLSIACFGMGIGGMIKSDQYFKQADSFRQNEYFLEEIANDEENLSTLLENGEIDFEKYQESLEYLDSHEYLEQKAIKLQRNDVVALLKQAKNYQYMTLVGNIAGATIAGICLLFASQYPFEKITEGFKELENVHKKQNENQDECKENLEE